MMKRNLTAIFGSIMVASWAVAGAKVEINENSWAELGFLGQVHFLNQEQAADKNDIYLRRARIILSGQIDDGIMFFAETDNDNAGKSGGASVSTDIQDAYIDVRCMKTDYSEMWFKAGLILLPFSFETRAGATKLLGIDYNSEAVKLVNTFVWRDYGAEIHGNIGRKFSYAAGAFDGYEMTGGTKNPEADLRLTGHVAYNLIGAAEKSWFYTQERLGANGDYLSLGVGVDYQPKATLTVTPATDTAPESSVVDDSDAMVVDIESGFDVGPMAVTVNGAYFDWDNASFKGTTAFVESGLRHKNTMITGKYSLQDPDGRASTEDYTGGLHYFLKGHNARAGIEYRWGDSPEAILAGIQVLL